MRKETKETNRSLSYQEQLEKIAYVYYVVCKEKELERIPL